MKRLKVVKYNIDIHFTTDVEGAISPVYKSDGKIDQHALSDYQEFLFTVFSLLDQHGFKIIEDHPSDNSETSYYISAYKKSESIDENIKCIFFIQVSDHPLSPDSISPTKTYYQHRAEELKQPKEKSHQVWRLKLITVNNEKYNSYEEVEEELDKKMKQW